MWQFATRLCDLVKMDLSLEASNGPRILTARHISADKSLPETNIAINTTLLCHSYSQNPDFASYYSGKVYWKYFIEVEKVDLNLPWLFFFYLLFLFRIYKWICL